MAALAHNVQKMVRWLSSGIAPPGPALPATAAVPAGGHPLGDATADSPGPLSDRFKVASATFPAGLAFTLMFVALTLAGCSNPGETPVSATEVDATVQAAVAAALSTETADIEATVEARVAATATAMPTPAPTSPTRTDTPAPPAPTPTPMPATPTDTPAHPTPTPTPMPATPTDTPAHPTPTPSPTSPTPTDTPVSPTPTPTPTVMIEVVPESPTGMVITWSHGLDNQVRQELYRDGELIAAPALGQSSYTDSGLSPNTRYEYRIVLRLGDASPATGEAEAATLVHAPGVAGPLDAHETGFSLAIVDDANPPETEYKVTVWNTEWWRNAKHYSHWSTSRHRTFEDLPTGLPFEFEVVARNLDGVRTLPVRATIDGQKWLILPSTEVETDYDQARTTGAGEGGRSRHSSALGACVVGFGTQDPGANTDLLYDCQNLLEMKDALAGTGALNWDESVPIDEWDGVSIGGDPGSVVGLNLSSRGLTGVIPGQLGRLASLMVLDLSHNRLKGSVPPELVDLIAAEVLRLDVSGLSGSLFDSLIDMTTMDPGRNQLVGEIRREIGRLRELRQLDLGDNLLTGEIPEEMGTLTNLETLDLGRNQLVGKIPGEIDQLRELRQLDLGDNLLTGEIPGEIGTLTNLERLDLGRNRLTGETPQEIGRLSELRQLDLGDNLLAGEIPGEIGTLTNLERLDLGRNQLTGEIPRELGFLSRLRHLLLGENSLRGGFPKELAFLTRLRTFDVSGNALGGCVPDGLKDIQPKIGSMQFCGDRGPAFEGGIDLGVTYIERLPRYQRYQIAYYGRGDCPYPFDEFMGATVCPEQDGIKRWPDPGEPVELIAHVWNFGDTESGPFEYEWKMDDESLGIGLHAGVKPGGHAAIVLLAEWPDDASNPAVTFSVDVRNEIDELIEDNNVVVDWIRGYSLGLAFTPGAYESLSLPNESSRGIQSPEQWVHDHIVLMNAMFAEAGLRDRVRAELFLITDDELLAVRHELRWYTDGWWVIRGPVSSHFTVENYVRRPDIDWGLIHELMHQLGVIDIYNMHLDRDEVLVPDANRPGQSAGCGTDYRRGEHVCFRFPDDIEDIMSEWWAFYIGPHTAGGLRTNTGYRRGYYGEYLYDTPEKTSLRIVDKDGNALSSVTLRFYQLEPRASGHFVDTEAEFVVSTDESGAAVLPNRGITGIVTETGHQLKPNPFGVIDVLGSNGIFLIEMEGPCISYEWLTIVELNLAYWEGHTGEAVFTKTMRCFPGEGTPAIHLVAPERPSCILQDSPNRSERLLTIMGEGFGSPGNSHLQFRFVDRGIESIHFGGEVEWISSTLIELDIGRIAGHLERADRQSLTVRITDSSYEPLSDWSDAFIVAANADAC